MMARRSDLDGDEQAVVGMRVSDMVPPASWTIVMASGVIAIDLYNVNWLALSTIMFGFAAAVWLLLAVVLGVPLVLRRGRFRRLAGSPVSLAAVAATAVLGTVLAVYDHHVAAAVLLAMAGTGWAVFVVPVLRHWTTPTVGISFVLGVATDGVALLSATLAIAFRAAWLLDAAVLLLLLGLAFYVFTAARFDLRQLIDGYGDHWIAGGALAISALCAGIITEAADVLGRFEDQRQVLTTGTLVLWCLAMVWLLPLIVTEAVRPRLGYDVRRWATVFPLGMYPACSFAVGKVTGVEGIITFGQVGTWVGVAALLLALAGTTRSIHRTWRQPAARPRVAADTGSPGRQNGQRHGS
jgi:tellurite resistance protein TehA-like permease